MPGPLKRAPLPVLVVVVCCLFSLDVNAEESCPFERELSQGHCCPLGQRWAPDECPPGWRWDEDDCECRNPCPASPWRPRRQGVEFVVKTAAAQARCVELWREAERLRAGEFHGEAASTYLDIYRELRDECQDVAGHCMDQVLDRAASSFEKSGQLGAAIQVRRRLIQEFGDLASLTGIQEEVDGGVAGRAMVEVGDDYLRIAAFSKAIEHYEAFARRFPHAPGAAQALQKATDLRIALGQSDAAQENWRFFREHLEQSPEVRASASQMVIELSEVHLRAGAWGRAEQLLDEFITELSAEGQRADLVLLYGALGRARWARGDSGREGAASAFRRALELADERAPVGEGRRARLRRYRVLANRAGGDDSTGEEAAFERLRGAIAQAHFFLGENQRELIGALSLPSFRPEGRLRAEVRSWLAARQTPGAHQAWIRALTALPSEERERRLRRAQLRFWFEAQVNPRLAEARQIMMEAHVHYQAASDQGAAEWDVAARARAAQTLLLLQRPLSQLRLPEDLSPSLARALESEAAHLRSAALETLVGCLGRAREHHWTGLWDGICERELHRLEPERFPMNDEISAAANHTYSPIALPEIILQESMEREEEVLDGR